MVNLIIQYTIKFFIKKIDELPPNSFYQPALELEILSSLKSYFLKMLLDFNYKFFYGVIIIQQLQQKKQMKNSSLKISQNLSKSSMASSPILSQKFTMTNSNKKNQQNNFLVQFFDEQLQIHFKNSVKRIPINFSLQFQIIYIEKQSKWRASKEIPAGFLLYYDNQVFELTRSVEDDQIQIWKRQLSKRIAQRGFNNQYRLVKKIKQKNHWIYTTVENLRNNKKFMCKGMKKDDSQISKEKQQYQNQINVWRKLNHYNLLKLHQVRQTQHSIYIIYEMIQQKCLAKRMIQTSFAIQQIQLIIKSIFQGLAQLHSKGIIHRDINPQSIFFRKYRDFQCLIGSFNNSCQSTQNKQICSQLYGTPGYISPQIFPQDQSKKYQYSSKSDIFSVGAILYELLLDKPLFYGQTKEQKMMQNVSASMNIKLSDFLLPKNDFNFVTKKEGFSLICKLLAQNPDDRPTAIEALNHPFLSIQETNQKKIKRCSQNISANKKKMVSSRRSLMQNTESIKNIKNSLLADVESCQHIESDQQKIDLYVKMQLYQFTEGPKFLSNK